MATSDRYWLAGLLEGEGYFLMANSRVGGKLYRYPRIGVNMSDRDIIQRVADLFGTSVYMIPMRSAGPLTKKQGWRATVMGVKAAEMMRELWPIMGERRQAKITEVLAEYGAIESTAVRRQRSCSEAATARWARVKAGGGTWAQPEAV